MNEHARMSPLANRLVTKMNGLGNEIVILDLRGTQLSVSAGEARAIGRGQGLGFDQLMVLHDSQSPGTDAFMTIHNIDGSRAGACGNGTRCVAWTLTRDNSRTKLTLETETARLDCLRLGEWTFSVDMGEPRLAWNEIPLSAPCSDTRMVDLRIELAEGAALANPSAVNMGNPHAIFWVEDLDLYDLGKLGPLAENHPIFPDRANISLAHVAARDHIELKVWERGAGATLACGSAACAALVAAARKDLTGRKARITLPGGDLFIDWRESDDHVIMTGPVELEFETRLDPILFKDIAA
jgi:diaminopimelate epimerase